MKKFVKVMCALLFLQLFTFCFCGQEVKAESEVVPYVMGTTVTADVERDWFDYDKFESDGISEQDFSG